MTKYRSDTADPTRTAADRIDWRASLKTPEAMKAAIVSRSLFSGQTPSAGDVANFLNWFADVGIPAIDAAAAEAKEKGVSIYALWPQTPSRSAEGNQP